MFARECHNILLMSMNASDVAFLNIHRVEYRYIISSKLVKMKL